MIIPVECVRKLNVKISMVNGGFSVKETVKDVPFKMFKSDKGNGNVLIADIT